jgi:hypothetical protein
MKKLDEAGAKAFASIVAAESVQLFIKRAKASPEDSGVFSTVISSDDEDRQGESVSQEGLDFSNYMKNPVVLWGHDYSSLPIGVCLGIERDGNKTVAKFRFASAEANPFAAQCQALWEAGIQRAVSIGFIPRSFDDAGNTLTAEVLEFSLVSIPANPVALNTDIVRQNNLDLAMLASKGIAFRFETTPTIDSSKPLNTHKTMKERIADLVAKGAEAGASCQLDDGTPGVLARDPGNPDGPLACVPTENASAKDGKVKPEDGDQDEDESNDNPQADDLQRSLEQTLEKEHGTHAAKSEKAIDAFTKAISGLNGDGAKSAKPTPEEKVMGAMHDGTDEEHDRHEAKCAKAIDTYTAGIQEWSSSSDDEPDEKRAAKPGDDEGEDDEDGGAAKPSTPTAIAKACKALTSDVAEEHDLHRKSMHKMIDAYGAKMVGAEPDVVEKHSKAMQSDASDEIERHEKAINAALDEFRTSTQVKPGEKSVSAKMSRSAKAGIAEAMKHLKAASALHESIADMHHEAKGHIKAASTALGGLQSGRGNDNDEDGGSPEDGEAAPSKAHQRSSPAKAAESTSELDAYIEARKLTRGVSTAVNDALKSLNEIISARKSQS